MSHLRGEPTPGIGAASPLVLALALLVAACGPGVQTPGRNTGDADDTVGPPKTLIVAIDEEPNILFSSMGSLSGRVSGLKLAYHQRLATYDDRGEIHPMLATELPSPELGTWTLRADGSMQTIYRLHPGVVWHDGTLLTPADFIFAWKVTRDPEIVMADRAVASQISDISAPDGHTLVIEWRRIYALANAIVEDDLGPLPAHLLEVTYQADKEAFQQLPYWTRDFVGVGPYRLGTWEPGTFLVLNAFDRFYRGRPKIDTLLFRFIGSEDAVVASLLAGEVDGSVGGASFSRTLFVKDEWERAGRRAALIAQPTNWRVLSIQFRPGLVSPPAIRDVRVRRALLHAIDRPALVEATVSGYSPVSDTFVPPDDVWWGSVNNVVVTYPFDPTRARQLLADVGWRPGADGSLESAGARVVIAHWSGSDNQSDSEGTIIADYWKNVGLTVERVILTPGQNRDNQLRVSYPASSSYAPPLNIRNILAAFRSSLCASEDNRWTGSNRTCYQNSEFDRVADDLEMAISEGAQRQAYRDVARILAEDLPVLPLYFGMTGMIFREGVSGFRGNTRPRTSPTWNAAEWDVERRQ